MGDYNNSQADPSRRISSSDLDRAKTDLSAAFKKIFTDELASKGGYEISETAAPDVLVLRPALINIEVSAPDLMAPGTQRNLRALLRTDDALPHVPTSEYAGRARLE